jgi:hypothetical protein
MLWSWVVRFSDSNDNVYVFFRKKSYHKRALVITIGWLASVRKQMGGVFTKEMGVTIGVVLVRDKVRMCGQIIFIGSEELTGVHAHYGRHINSHFREPRRYCSMKVQCTVRYLDIQFYD